MMDYDAAVVDALCHSFTGIFDVFPVYESDPNFLHLQVLGRCSNRKLMNFVWIKLTKCISFPNGEERVRQMVIGIIGQPKVM